MGGKKGGGLGGIVNSGKDILFGKKDTGTKDRYMALEGEQQEALAGYNKLLKTDTDALARNSIMAQENAIRANAGDAQRQAQDLIAQRGLGRSSVGLNAILNSTRNMGEQIGQVRGQLPTLAYDLKTKNLDRATSGIQNILNNRTFIQGREGTGRNGGLVGFGKDLAVAAAPGIGAYMAKKQG
jgi:hypothetical protein